MKRSEYSAIVDEVINEELEYVKEKYREYLSSPSQEALAKLLGEAFLQTPEVATRAAASLLVKTGVVILDDSGDSPTP